MDRFVNSMGKPPRVKSQQTPRSSVQKKGDMALEEKSPPKSPLSQLAENDGEKEFATSQIDYKKLAIEVAKHLSKDLQDSLSATLASSLKQIQEDLGSHESRIAELEKRVSGMEEEREYLHGKLHDTAEEARVLWDRAEDLENRSRRNNLRLVGITEEIPPRDLIHLCEKKLPELLGLSSSCRVERAHRLGVIGRGGGDPRTPRPRHVIAKFLDYRDKEAILRAYKQAKGAIELRGAKISVFGDYSQEVTRRRRAFAPICTALFKKNTRFALLFPATLRVSCADGTTRTFQLPREAAEALHINLPSSSISPRESMGAERSSESARRNDLERQQ